MGAARPLARRLPRLPRRARRAVGAPGAASRRACSAGDAAVARALLRAGRAPFVYPARRSTPRIVGEVREHEGRRSTASLARARAARAATSSSARGGIREIEFLVQALQLLYGGDDPWLRERNSLRAIFRLTERGYLAPDLGRAPRRRARPPAHRRAPAADPARVPDPHAAGGAAARSGASRGAWASRCRRPRRRRRFLADAPRASPRGVHRGVPRVLRARRRPRAAPPAAHPELHRAQGHRLRRSRSRAPEPRGWSWRAGR